MFSMIGIPYAAVLPVPVWACPTRPREVLRIRGVIFSCIGVGSSNPFFLTSEACYSKSLNSGIFQVFSLVPLFISIWFCQNIRVCGNAISSHSKILSDISHINISNGFYYYSIKLTNKLSIQTAKVLRDINISSLVLIVQLPVQKHTNQRHISFVSCQ